MLIRAKQISLQKFNIGKKNLEFHVDFEFGEKAWKNVPK